MGVLSFCRVANHVCAAEEYLQMPGDGYVPPAIDATPISDEVCNAMPKQLEGIASGELHIFVRSGGFMQMGTEPVNSSANLFRQMQ